MNGTLQIAQTSFLCSDSSVLEGQWWKMMRRFPELSFTSLTGGLQTFFLPGVWSTALLWITRLCLLQRCVGLLLTTSQNILYILYKHSAKAHLLTNIWQAWIHCTSADFADSLLLLLSSILVWLSGWITVRERSVLWSLQNERGKDEVYIPLKSEITIAELWKNKTIACTNLFKGFASQFFDVIPGKEETDRDDSLDWSSDVSSFSISRAANTWNT